jgi:UDP-N-acetylmuramate dehydrogenase
MISPTQLQTLKTFGQVKLNEPLSKYTTFKIGGPADLLLIIKTTDELVQALTFMEGEGIPFFILGGGSNMLVSDEGFRGVAVKVAAKDLHVNGTEVVADAGCITAEVAQATIKAGLTGFEWGVGVPGTIGGAVRGNAGAVGSEMRMNVKRVTVYEDGQVREYTNEECVFAYRESVFKHTNAFVLRVTLSLGEGSNTEALKKAMEYLAFRAKTQPQGFSSGCIFKNVLLEQFAHAKKDAPALLPEFKQKGIVSAGWMIEQSKAKGLSVGKAVVSEKHGNFMLNTGGATAADILALIDKVKENVYDTFGISLEEEVQII